MRKLQTIYYFHLIPNYGKCPRSSLSVNDNAGARFLWPDAFPIANQDKQYQHGRYNLETLMHLTALLKDMWRNANVVYIAENQTLFAKTTG